MSAKMKANYIIFLLVSIMGGIACSYTNKLDKQGRNTAKINEDLIDVAWNDDTVMVYQLAMLKRDRFLYVVSRKDETGNIKRIVYNGIIKYATDTFYLVYDDEIPADLTNYLVLEISGHYLIQYFKNSSQRIFMRIREHGRHPYMFY